MLLKVGLGYVWANTGSGNMSAARMIFFMGSSGNGDYARIVPGDSGCGRLGCGEAGKYERNKCRQWHRTFCDLAILNLPYRDDFGASQWLGQSVNFGHGVGSNRYMKFTF